MIQTADFYALPDALQEKLLNCTYWYKGWMMRPYVKSDKTTQIAYMMDGDKVIGWTAICWRHNNLVMTFVDEDHRGRGYGKMLVRELLRTFDPTHWRNEEGVYGSMRFFEKVRFSIHEDQMDAIDRVASEEIITY